MIGVLFYKLGAFFARRLPQRLSETITEAIVASQYMARFRSRRIVRGNLRAVIGRGPVDVLTRRVFSNFGRSLYYFLRLPFMARGELEARCDLGGLDKVVTGLDGGCVFAGPHMGAWEVGGACLSALGVELVTVALPHRSARVTAFFNERRELLGMECASLPHSAETLRRALLRGKSVALLVDRVYGVRAGRFEWFGREVDLPLGHVALAVRYRLPVVTAACVFAAGDRFKFVYGGPHYPRTDIGCREAMEDLQQKCITDMTRFIREYPDQWFHFEPLGGTSRSDNGN